MKAIVESILKHPSIMGLTSYTQTFLTTNLEDSIELVEDFINWRSSQTDCIPIERFDVKIFLDNKLSISYSLEQNAA